MDMAAEYGWWSNAWPYVAVAAALLVLWWLGSRRAPTPEFPDYDPKPFMNDGEWACHTALVRAAGSAYHVFAQVSLYAVVQHLSADGWPRIAQKSCDFVLVDAGTLRTALVVEVDGRQHQTSQVQRRRDQDKDAALAAAGIPILRIPAAKRYDPIHLQSQIRAALD